MPRLRTNAFVVLVYHGGEAYTVYGNRAGGVFRTARKAHEVRVRFEKKLDPEEHGKYAVVLEVQPGTLAQLKVDDWY